MRRVLGVFREWLELRARIREEHRFHLDQAVADLHSLGLSRRDAMRAARARFGPASNLRLGRREFGGDCSRLVHLFRAHRVLASVWLQPLLLLAAVLAILLLSPAPLLVLESIAGKPLAADAHQPVYLSVPAPWPLFTGITSPEFQALRSLPALTKVERYRTIYVRGVAQGATLAAIESAARARTGNSGIRVVSLFEQKRIGMGPAMAVWILIVFHACFSLRSHVPQFGKIRWLLYAGVVGSLHVFVSVTAWAFAVQTWSRISWPTHLTAGLAFSVMLVAYLLLAAAQCAWWRRDLSRRCPICFERLLLASTEGFGDRMLLSMAVTESVCAHGHGVLVENRWTRQFRREESPLLLRCG